jgi:hypothetical protein
LLIGDLKPSAAKRTVEIFSPNGTLESQMSLSVARDASRHVFP